MHALSTQHVVMTTVAMETPQQMPYYCGGNGNFMQLLLVATLHISLSNQSEILFSVNKIITIKCSSSERKKWYITCRGHINICL